MTDILAMVYGFARAAWRRRWLAVATAWIISLLGWGVVMTLPNRYEATAKVFVDTVTSLRPALEGIAIQEDSETQLALVREELRSTPQLEAVAASTNLDAGITTPEAKEALIRALQNEIRVSSAAPVQGGRLRETIYTIAYQNADRDTSVNVVRTLLHNFEEGIQSGTRSGAGDVQDFLGKQIADQKKILEDIESQVMEFKQRNIGMIPGESGDYMARFEQETAGLLSAETALAGAISRRTELQKQLEAASIYVPGTSAAGSAAGVAPDVTVRLQEAEQRLEQLKLKYTDLHWEVKQLKETIAELKARETKELTELQRGGAGTGAIRSLNANPVRQEIETKLNAVREEIAAHQGTADRHRREIAKLRRFVDQAPEVTQEHERLIRNHAAEKATYERLLGRSGETRISDGAARSGIVDFKIIEAPSASFNPVSPKRQLLIIVVLVLAVGAGVAVALLPHFLSPTFSDTASLERQFDLPVLGAVSAVRTTAQRDNQLSDVRRVALAGFALVALAGVLVVMAPAGARMLRGLIA